MNFKRFTLSIITILGSSSLFAQGNVPGVCPEWVEYQGVRYEPTQEPDIVEERAEQQLGVAIQHLESVNRPGSEDDINTRIDGTFHGLHTTKCYIRDLYHYPTTQDALESLEHRYSTTYARAHEARHQAKLEWDKYNQEQQDKEIGRRLKRGINRLGKNLQRIWDDIRNKCEQGEDCEAGERRYADSGYGTYRVNRNGEPWTISFEKNHLAMVHLKCGSYAPNMNTWTGANYSKTIEIDRGEYMRVRYGREWFLVSEMNRC
ncbi:MAG: hypothetical protein ACSHXZ_09430 [Gammaproteobacteria bacterium]